MNDAFPNRRKKLAVQKSKLVPYTLRLEWFNNVHSPWHVIHDGNNLFTALRRCINLRVKKMSRNVLKCLNEPTERFILPLSVGVRRSEQIFTCVADRAVWICMLGLWDFQCRRGGRGGASKHYRGPGSDYVACVFSLYSIILCQS
jgi:hypothetical protein